MDVLFLVVDSLRAHPFADGRVAHTPFLDSLSRRGVWFERAYATECWTLPSHVSMFTGLMPSEHGAHFRTMAYRGSAPTIAERMRARGYRTELMTRNFVFDGTMHGVNRGFDRCARVVSSESGWDPVATLLAMAKPRFRRHLRNTGFFAAAQRDNRDFLETFARCLRPADAALLDRLRETLAEYRRGNQRCFLFANLYDVHAPYAPSDDSLLRDWRSLDGVRENLLAPWALSRLGEHRYLQEGFRIADSIRDLLERRYRRAVERVDRLLAAFFRDLSDAGLLDELLVILVGDHGEGFGEHGLFLHDASLFETHVHVPLWVSVPAVAPEVVSDVVSTRHIADLIDRACTGELSGTILDPELRSQNPVACAQHVPYPHVANPKPEYRGEQFAAMAGDQKVLVRGGERFLYDRRSDPGESTPATLSPSQLRDWFHDVGPKGRGLGSRSVLIGG